MDCSSLSELSVLLDCDHAAIQQLQILSDQGILLAKGYFGILLYYGLGVTKDEHRANQLQSECLEPLNTRCSDPTYAPYAHYITY